jgi:Flp pilus assembly pilin Flp
MRSINWLHTCANYARSFHHAHGAATSIEYALLAAGIALAFIVAVNRLGIAVRFNIFMNDFGIYWGH